MIREKKFFSLDYLNAKIQGFKYQGSDANSKPCTLKGSLDKLGGHAAQNWCLIRLIPLLLASKVKTMRDDEVWLLCLKLRRVVELVCAPKISRDDASHLKFLIQEYILDRSRLFPASPLKPKHHYLIHYADLILNFGPLIRVWTLRFESKHSYFKQCARKLHNFKNLCKTLAVRHQLLQAFLSEGSVLPQILQIEKGVEFYVHDYRQSIQDAVAKFTFNPENCIASYSVTYKGTEYKRGLFLPVGCDDSGIVFARIEVILVSNSCEVYLVATVYQSLLHVDSGLHCLVDYDSDSESDEVKCFEIDRFADYYPLPSYEYCKLTAISLHHALNL